MWGQHPYPIKKYLATETNTARKNLMDLRNRPGEERMKRTSRTRKEADLQMNLLFPKTVTRIGTWNVRTLYETGKSAQVAREMDRYGMEVLGLSEVRWTSCGQVTLASGHILLYSGPPNENDEHRNGVGLMLTKRASRSLLEWEPVSERILTARFHSKFQKVTVIQCHQ